MSSRHLRRLKEKNELVEDVVVGDSEEDSSEDEDDSEVEETVVRKPNFSALLMDDDDDDDDDQSSEEEESSEEEKKPPKKPTSSNAKKQQPAKQVNNGKGKNNKNQGKQAQPQQQKSNNNNSNNNSKNKKNKNKKSNDIDDLVDIVNGLTTTTTTTTTTTSDSNSNNLDTVGKLSKEILSIEVKNLNPVNELKRLLSCKASDMKDPNKKKSSNYLQHNQSLSKKIFMVPKADWPPLFNQFTMETDRIEGETHYFKLRWSNDYAQVQEEFLNILSRHDPMMISELLRFHPFHVDSLLQLSQVCLQMADFQHSGDLVERAVFAMECSCHHLFNPVQGNSRLDYKIQENKTFFLTFFRHIQILGRRGCPRTALEFSKMLLSLDYSDPLYIRLIIDYYSLRSRQYDYLIKFCEKVKSIGSSHDIQLLPNFSYSYALASFLSSDKQPQREKSDQLLQMALIRFPMLLKPLLTKLKATLLTIKPDGKPFNLEEHPYFKPTDDELKPVQHLVTLYVERCHLLWEDEPIQQWLKENVKAVIAKVDARDPLIQETNKQILKEYSIMDQSIFDHLFLSEYSDVVQRLPPDVIEMMRRDGYNNIEPPAGLDPRRGIGAGYQFYRRQQQHVQQQQQQMMMEQELLQQQQLEPLIQEMQQQNFQANPNAHPILTFLQSLLPILPGNNNNGNNQPQRGFLDDYIDFEQDEEDEQQ